MISESSLQCVRKKKELWSLLCIGKKEKGPCNVQRASTKQAWENFVKSIWPFEAPPTSRWNRGRSCTRGQHCLAPQFGRRSGALCPSIPLQHDWQQLVTRHVTLVMGASIVMEWILAIEECRLWELPVRETKQNLYPDFNDKAWQEHSAKKTWFGFRTAYPAVPFRGNLLQNSYTCLFMLGTHKRKEMLAEPLISLIEDK